MGAGGAYKSAPPDNLRDPKDRIADRDRLTEAEQLLRGGSVEAALWILDDVLPESMRSDTAGELGVAEGGR